MGTKKYLVGTNKVTYGYKQSTLWVQKDHAIDFQI